MDLSNSAEAKSPPLTTFIKKSLSTIRLSGAGNQNLPVREAKSFTGAMDELKNATNKNYGGSINCHKQIYTTTKLYKSQIEENGYDTREVVSNEIFVVKDEMLTYRGKRYSLCDIAVTWKKDCRMWLWKSNKRGNPENMKINSNIK